MIQTLGYAWVTTVGNGMNFTFNFSGYLSITVTRATGTSNLYGMPEGVFNGREKITVP
ncbi:MAG: hypothetical protein OEZ06_04005 [Myxococcales bacterium]|nr:hypothetical protein [Myxococcales bacterium]